MVQSGIQAKVKSSVVHLKSPVAAYLVQIDKYNVLIANMIPSVKTPNVVSILTLHSKDKVK